MRFFRGFALESDFLELWDRLAILRDEEGIF